MIYSYIRRLRNWNKWGAEGLSIGILLFIPFGQQSAIAEPQPIPVTVISDPIVNVKIEEAKALKPLPAAVLPEAQPIELVEPPDIPPASENGMSHNTYDPGQCTWGVKNWRPDIPNSWGNADTWFSRARAMGWPTGYSPRPGAIGQQGMHVVYILQVYGDGTVLLKEMNYDYVPFHVRTRVAPASDFVYIY